jgi:hypothetical protein
MFYDHKKYRDPLAEFTPRFQTFLRGLGPLNEGQSLLSNNARRHAEPSLAGPSNKCSCLSGNIATPPVEQAVEYLYMCGNKITYVTFIGA